MSEKRHPSSDATRVIDESDLRRLLAGTYGPEAEKPYEAIPDDEPTRPEGVQAKCRRCAGTRKTVVEVAPGRYAGPRPCPRCVDTGGIDPGTPYDPEDPFAGDVKS